MTPKKWHLVPKGTSCIWELLYRTPRLVHSGTNWNQEFCYRGPPRTKRHGVSECRNPPPPDLTYNAVQYKGSPRFDYWNLLRRGWGLKIFWSILIFCRNFFPKGQKLICYSKKKNVHFFWFFLYFLGDLRGGGHLYNFFFSEAPIFPHWPKKSQKKCFLVTFGCRKKGDNYFFHGFSSFQLFHGWI